MGGSWLCIHLCVFLLFIGSSKDVLAMWPRPSVAQKLRARSRVLSHPGLPSRDCSFLATKTTRFYYSMPSMGAFCGTGLVLPEAPAIFWAGIQQFLYFITRNLHKPFMEGRPDMFFHLETSYTKRGLIRGQGHTR